MAELVFISHKNLVFISHENKVISRTPDAVLRERVLEGFGIEPEGVQ